MRASGRTKRSNPGRHIITEHQLASEWATSAVRVPPSGETRRDLRGSRLRYLKNTCPEMMQVCVMEAAQ